MTRKHVLVTLAAVFCLSGAALADDQEMSDEQAAMEAMMKVAAPGPHHEHMDHLVGKWTYEMKMWMQPGQPPMESGGTMEASWSLGGRFVDSVVHGEFMGQSFEGRSVDGYDNGAEKHFSFWRDNMGTMAMYFEGDCSDGGKVTTMTAEFLDPASGKKMKQRGVTTVIDDDHYKYESYTSGPDMPEWKSMELVATRSE